MDEKADLESRAVEALQRYREALAKAEALEKEEAVARRALADWLRRLERPRAKDALLDRREAMKQGQGAISNLTELRAALSAATAALDKAYHDLVALDHGLEFLRRSKTGLHS
jgi:DNA repair ATPase RecN